MVQFAIEVASKVLCYSLLIIQGSLLNAYLVKVHHYVLWLSWICADVVIISVWTLSLAMVRKSFRSTKRKRDDGDHVDGRDPEQSPDEIKYSYLAWLVYVIFLCPRVLLIFQNVKGNVNDADILGTNLLKVVVSCTPLIYLLLVNGFHNAEPMTSRKLYIQSIAASGTLDLFDSVDILELLFEAEHGIRIPQRYVIAILVFASLNWFLPLLGLTGLRIKTMSGRVASLQLKTINVLSVMILVNIPNLVIRSALWINYDADVSVLIMKNVMCLFLGMYEIFEYFGEKPPKQCERCTDWYDHLSYRTHRENCLAKYRTYSSCPEGDVAVYQSL